MIETRVWGFMSCAPVGGGVWIAACFLGGEERGRVRVGIAGSHADAAVAEHGVGIVRHAVCAHALREVQRRLLLGLGDPGVRGTAGGEFLARVQRGLKRGRFDVDRGGQGNSEDLGI
jgi:hypothetical protein